MGSQWILLETFEKNTLGEEWIATKQMMVQCPVCQASYHLKELRNLDQVWVVGKMVGKPVGMGAP